MTEPIEQATKERIEKALKECVDILIMMKRELIAVNKNERWEIEPICWLADMSVDEALKVLESLKEKSHE